MNELIPLNMLHAGCTAFIGQVTGRPEQIHRLEELGLRGGAAVEMVQPGSPCIIRLAGHKLCFRADELLRVLVRPGGAGVTALADLAIAGRGRVVRVAGSDEISLRLLEMGLTPGAEVEMLGVAPLGDPLELEVRGYRLSLRRAEAARVEINPL